jgi:outer membrane receptor for ferrienterochelin and colicin
MMGNDDLKAETSINKEIGLEFKRDGWLAGVPGSVTITATRLKRVRYRSPDVYPVKTTLISISGKTFLKQWLRVWKVR